MVVELFFLAIPVLLFVCWLLDLCVASIDQAEAERAEQALVVETAGNMPGETLEQLPAQPSGQLVSAEVSHLPPEDVQSHMEREQDFALLQEEMDRVFSLDEAASQEVLFEEVATLSHEDSEVYAPLE